MTLHSGEVRGPDDFQRAFATVIKERPQGLLILDDPLFFQYRTSIVDFAAKHRLPAMHPFKESVEAGGFMAYSVRLADMYRRAAVLVDKILKGAKPADLPVEQPTAFELVINPEDGKSSSGLQSRRRCWPVPIRSSNERSEDHGTSARHRHTGPSNFPLQRTAHSRCSRLGR